MGATGGPKSAHAARLNGLQVGRAGPSTGEIPGRLAAGCGHCGRRGLSASWNTRGPPTVMTVVRNDLPLRRGEQSATAVLTLMIHRESLAALCDG